jgi:hypothetical protein
MNSSILDVALGLSIVFATFALVASGLNEAIASVLNLRGRMLVSALNQLAGDKVGVALLNTSLLKGLGRKPAVDTKSQTAPSYVPSWLLAAATLNGDAAGVATTKTLTLEDGSDELQTALSKSPLTKVVASLVDAGAQEGDKLEAALADWYDRYMERVSGWYKRQAQTILLVLGIVVALVANVDAIGMTRVLLNDPGVRAQAATAAQSADQCGTASTLDCATATAQTLPLSQLGLFWAPRCQPPTANCPTDFWGQRGLQSASDYLLKALGLIAGGFAISLGAPFWFDLIGRGKALKGTGGEPPDASDEDSPPPLAPPATPVVASSPSPVSQVPGG